MTHDDRPREPADARTAEVIAGRYRLIERLGAGGGGEVYRAHDRELDREVAIKLLTGASERSVARFRREVGLAQALSHPGLVRVYDIGNDGGGYYLSMQLVDGKSLSARLRDEGPIGIAEARRLFAELGDAVRYLHSAGVIHRDIKPANVLLDATGGRALLADFGLARPVAEAEGDHTEIAGTPGYMPPEVMLGEPPSASTDIYGLGATIYSALTGKRAVDGSSWRKILERGREGITTLRRARVDVPADLAFVVDTCLRADPSERFRTMDEVLEALEHADGRRRLRRRVPGRRRGWIAVASAVAVAVAGAGAWALHARGQVVDVRADGKTVRGFNRFGGVVWERTYAGEKVTVDRWPPTCGGPARYRVGESFSAASATTPRHNHLLAADGSEVFDASVVDDKDLGFLDPRRVSSGALVYEVFPWSRCQAPDAAGLPLMAWNDPWYATVFGVLEPGREPKVGFAFSGRINAIAASKTSPTTFGIVVGNHELLHASAFAIVRADRLHGADPPHMVDQSFEGSGLVSYTLLPIETRTYGGDAVVAEPDGSWKVCTPDSHCDAIDRFGNLEAALRAQPGVDPAALLRDRMARFHRLSELDKSRRQGAYDVADEGYRAAAATPAGSDVEQAALHLIGARIAAARGDLPGVVERTGRSEALWQLTQDATLLRADARICAGQHADALRDLELAEGRRASARYNTTKARFVSAWLGGDHDLARRLVDEIDFPVIKDRLRAFVLLEDGEPARALALLDPWQVYFARERIELYRAIALVDLGRLDDATRALDAERKRHPWLAAEIDAVALASDLAAGHPAPVERALAVLAAAERAGRDDLDARLLRARVRVIVAGALTHAGANDGAARALAGIEADHPGLAIAARAHELAR